MKTALLEIENVGSKFSFSSFYFFSVTFVTAWLELRRLSLSAGSEYPCPLPPITFVLSLQLSFLPFTCCLCIF
jgi:hypothetical protein